MTTEWNGEEAKDDIRQAAAEGVLFAAKFLWNSHQTKLNIPNPPPYLASSKQGEYPRKRTGAGSRGVLHDPTSVDGVKKNDFKCRVGMDQSVFYMFVLESRGWLGLMKTLEEVEPQMAAAAVNVNVGGTG